MTVELFEHLLKLTDKMNLIKDETRSNEYEYFYRMLPKYGHGYFKFIRFENRHLLILIADFTPKDEFEKYSHISEDYLEISQLETSSSSFKIGKRKTIPIDKGIYCYLNTNKETYTYCKANKEVRFTKVILTKKYFDAYLQSRYKLSDYYKIKTLYNYLLKNPNLPELNFVFQQIREFDAQGDYLILYLESKVMELLSLITKSLNSKDKELPVILSKKDKQNLKKVVNFMKKDLSAYPTGIELSKIAFMSPARFQLAFRKYYGTTPYEYLKQMRLNEALLLLKNPEYKISTIASEIGYQNSGHFSKLFKQTYGILPREYRKMIYK